MSNYFSALAQKMIYPGIPSTEARRRYLFALMSIVNIIVSQIVVARGYYTYGFPSPNVWIPLSSTIAGIGGLMAIRLLRRIEQIYLIAIIYYGVILFYATLIGTDNGTPYLWLYLYPTVTYALLGTEIGKFIIALNWIASASVITLNIGTYHYPISVGFPFIMSYSFTCIVAYGIELSRTRYYNQVQAEKLALESALNQIKTLEDLLPICASCKKIRDDSGYWHQVDTYMHDQRGIEFTHGICPECHAELMAQEHDKVYL